MDARNRMARTSAVSAFAAADRPSCTQLTVVAQPLETV